MISVKEPLLFNVLVGLVVIVIASGIKDPFLYYTLVGSVVVIIAMQTAWVYTIKKESKEREEKLIKYISDTKNARRDLELKKEREREQYERRRK